MSRDGEVVATALSLLEQALRRRVEGALERSFGDGWPSLTGLPRPGSQRRWLLRVLQEHEELLSPVVGGSQRAVQRLLGQRRWLPGRVTARILSAVIALLVALAAPEADAVLALKAAWEQGEVAPPGGPAQAPQHCCAARRPSSGPRQ